MEKKLYALSIDSDFEAMIPRHKDCELQMLTESLLENGCEVPILVWGSVIVDGHVRYRICHEHRIPFAVEEKEFDSRSEAEAWIIQNQLGRRNLSSFEKCELVLPFAAELRQEGKKRQGWRGDNRGIVPDGKPANTRKTLADMAGVSNGTMQKAMIISRDADEETKRRLRNSEISIHFAYSSLMHKPSTPSHNDGQAQVLMDIKDAVTALSAEVDKRQMNRGKMREIIGNVMELIDRGM